MPGTCGNGMGWDWPFSCNADPVTNPLPKPEESAKPGPRLLQPQLKPSGSEVVYDWGTALRAHGSWWLHRRRLQWKQSLAAILVILSSLLLWLLLVEALD